MLEVPGDKDTERQEFVGLWPPVPMLYPQCLANLESRSVKNTQKPQTVRSNLRDPLTFQMRKETLEKSGFWKVTK